MVFTDTHTHLYDEKLIKDPEQIPRAVAAGVTKMYMPNCDSNTIEGMMVLAKQWPGTCLPMMGLHPCYVKDDYLQELEIAAEWLKKEKFYAIGEIGLDYHWDITWKEQQIIALETQIEWALQYELPIVIHSRKATQDCINVIRKKQNGQLKGVFHCFSGSMEEARKILALGFYLGIGGVATYKNSGLGELLKEVPLEQLILETDAPYLSPEPYRGRRNESAFIPVIAAKLAAIRGCSIEEIALATTANAEALFG